jgi:L-ascorbate metabolism protein UlaG (beta-lactamase superfamily)
MRRSAAIMAWVTAAAAAAGIATSVVRLPAAGGEVRLQPLVHASVAVEFEGRVIYVDPWSAADLSNAPQSDLILVTDADTGAHHLDPVAVAKLRKPGGTIVIPAAGLAKVPDGIVLPNGVSRTFGNVKVETVPSYDLLPGEPFHARGASNGYLLTLGGTRVYFAGVTECIPEIRALRDVDVAFLPMNSPNGRMTPAAVAECVRSFSPRVVYPYHYDPGYVSRRAAGRVAQASHADVSVRELTEALSGFTEVRLADWYPADR